jgi:tRNA 2-selenouridine synthase
VLEDEGHMIGANHLPECLRERMAQSPLAVVEDPFEIRLERLREEYFDRTVVIYRRLRRRERLAVQRVSASRLFAIRRRLGLQRFAQLTALLDEALAQQRGEPPGWCRC